MEYEQPEYAIWARHSGGRSGLEFERIDQVDDWSSLSIDLKWADSSTWQLTLPFAEFIQRWDVTAPAGSLIAEYDGAAYCGPYGLIVFRNGGDYAGEPVEYPAASGKYVLNNNDLVISGPITHAHREWKGGDDMLTLTGEQDTWYLKTRMTWPAWDHGYLAPTWWWTSTGQDNSQDWAYGFGASQHIEAHAQNYVYRNMYYSGVNPNHGEVGIPFFTVSTNRNQGDHAPDDYNTRFETCFEAVQGLIALHSDPYYYSFDAIQVSETAANEDGRIKWRFLAPRDMSADIVFGTEMGTVKSFEYDEQVPEYNAVMVGGPNWNHLTTSKQSDDKYKMYREVGDTTSQARYGRIEGFEAYSGTDTTTTTDKIAADMLSQGQKLIREKALKVAGKIELDSIQSEQFMREYQLGDYVTVSLNDQVWIDYIREVQIDITPEGGEIVTPTVCDPTAFYWTGGPTHAIARDTAAKLRRFQRLGSH